MAPPGNIQMAVEAIVSANHPHTFLGTSETGQSAILFTSGNPECHIILRGGRQVTNYDAAAVASTAEQMEKAGVQPRIMIDCSHANSGKDFRKQGASAATSRSRSQAETAASWGS